MLNELVRTAKIAVCVGAGGVGKTTVAASLALAAAKEGRRALVVTIDPARRLAGALGLERLGDEPQRVHELPLFAMMLDRERAWDRLVARHSPDPDTRDRILGNRLYQELSRRFAGTHEYLAVEELFSLAASKQYDLIVLDTPPAPHAFAFLDAPDQVRKLFNRRLLRWGLMATRAGSASIMITPFARNLLSRLEAATGSKALEDFVELFTALSSLFDVLASRAKEVTHLVRAPDTHLVLVCGPDSRGVSDAELCLRELTERGLPPRALVMNRLHRPLPPEDTARLDAFPVHGPLGEWLLQNYDDHQRHFRGQLARLSLLGELAPPGAVLTTLPILESDVHDLAALERMASLLVS